MEAQVTQKCVNLHKSFFMNYGRASVGKIAISNLLKIRMSVDMFGTEKCKVTFVLNYISNYIVP